MRMLLQAFDYTQSADAPTIEAIIDMKESVTNSNAFNSITIITLALVYIVLVYITLLPFAWYISKKRLVSFFGIKSFDPYKYMLFGQGDADSVSTVQIVIYTVFSILALILVMTGAHLDFFMFLLNRLPF